MKTLLRLSIFGLLSCSLVIIMFLLSENQMHRNNAFVRRYPHHPITKKYDLSLKYNSYYIAGYENEILYLGNTTAPLHLLEVNLKTKDTQHIRITLDRMDLPFRSITVKFHPPYFFVTDGFVPCIFRGNIGDWHASLWMKNKTYFTRAIPIDSNKLYIKAISSKTNEATLGVLEKQDDFNIILDPDLLERQIDGMFDVDGTMIVSEDKENLGYVYFYRNQFMIMNPDLKLLRREETIDTVRVAQIQLSQKNELGEIKMKVPPLEVNKTAALYQNLMMIHSNRLGKYEEKSMLNQAAIIDVYNWKKQSYQFSFYLYNIGQRKVREFNVYNNHLVALIDVVLSVYQLKPSHF
ncbi:hypothetical protein [Changchengzhania lutea]|uniref:hypothetical protein n=1 Tax=Changchengzhania lutea TaxID=2049305 RepID=UPI00115D8200|nr:hypothetical protein [Changchengzhania lutea]